MIPNYAPQTGQGRRGRKSFRDEATVSRGLLFLAVGTLFLAISIPMLLASLQLQGTPGTLTVSSCATGGGSHPVITCTGDFQLNSGGTVHTGAWLSEQQLYPVGTRLKVQQGANGSLQAVSGKDQLGLAAFAGLGAVGALTGVFTVLAALGKHRRPRIGQRSATARS
ncbi:hypothetical protein ABH940_007091 [Streptacidiphilus sp. BW17]